MKFPIIEFKQNNNQFISTVLPFKIINETSKVLVYGKDMGGYQREPDELHYNRIKSYVNNEPNFLFPTSIILGVDNDIIKKYIIKENGESYLDFSKINSKIFRIVDGQHRIKGLREAMKTNELISSLELSVNILCTLPNSQSIEMEVFGSINSKSKRIKVDLIELARYEYRIIEQTINISEINDHISIQVAFNLNENNSITNVWENGIKFGIHDEEKIGIIGVNAFKESIRNIVNSYLSSNKNISLLKKEELIEKTKEAAKDIEIFMLKAWEQVYKKWPNCFYSMNQEIDFNLDVKNFHYKTNYYIQKTLGVKSINNLLGNIIQENENRIDNSSLNIFTNILNNSEVITKDWEIGYSFSGYSSESGFAKVTKIIRGDLSLSRV